MQTKAIIIHLLLVFTIFLTNDSAWAKLVIHSQTAVKIELLGYNGLAESTIFKGDLSVGSKREIDPAYRGLALLVFAGGQRYPVIIGDKSFTLKIGDLGKLPSFTGSEENDFFYKSLAGGAPPPEQYDFALLMIRAKDMLESSQSIKTVKGLTAKKKEFHGFVAKHYEMLKHSDMIKRFIAQYFMMHEYVDYHSEGAPATGIQAKYQKEVINGVGSWLETLKPHLPEPEILNYCVSLYYQRSMVTLAALIVENFRDVAYCSGAEKETLSFPRNLLIAEADGNKEIKLADIKGNKLIAFVSEDCPVSMVETISKVRQLAGKRKNTPVIVAPLQKLSSNHLAMARMISNGKMIFVNDEKWRKTNLVKKVKLPLFVRLGDEADLR
ncbi:MAG: hypothetical protein ABFS18_14830 [Thermodesulfobacteriota bacterium]